MQNIKLMLEYTKDLRVLYVEDDLDLLETTSELLENYFYSVDIASDGKDGLKQYLAYEKENASSYDLVITDINMPNMDGLEMSESILVKNSMQSIIVISAHNEINYLIKSIDLGINGFLTKPINQESLVKTLYKVSQAISDHKFVESHVDMMEDLNMRLELQNRELLAKNRELEKSFRMLDTMVHKDQLSKSTQEPDSTQQDSYLNSEHKLEQIRELVNNDLFELKEILIEIDMNVIEIINNVENLPDTTLKSLVKLFSKYSSILHFYSFFDELSSSMSSFSKTMSEHPLPQNQESTRNIFMLLESFIYVLGKWHEEISSGDEAKINQFDASIISDINTIQNMWVEQEQTCSEDDLDGIFDF